MIWILAVTVAFGLLISPGWASAEKITLRYWSFLDPSSKNPRSAAQTEIINNFMKRNPDIEVKVEVVHWSKMVPMLITAVGAGNAPDVVLVHSSRMPKTIESGSVIRLDPYVERWSRQEKEDFLLDMKEFYYKGQLYSLPWEHRVEGILMYRRDLLSQAGISNPPRTWREVELTGKKLASSNLWGFVWALSRKDGAANIKTLQPLYWSLGGDFYHPDGTAAINSAAGVRIAETFKRFVLDENIMPRNLVGVEEARTMTKAGRTAMLVEGTQVFGNLQAGQGIGDNLTTAPLPSLDSPDKPAPAVVAGQTLGISVDSKHPDAAWKFIDHMISPESQIINARVAKNLPMRRSAYEDPWFKSPDAAELVNWKNYILQGGRTHEQAEFSDFMNDALALAYEQILTGQKPVKAALDEAAERFNQRVRQKQ
jgi:ABC-type glycerol-3-phosphate transport system substrate-binding protein